MKRLLVVLTVLSLALAVAPAAMGDFHTPPHTNPDIDWETAHPYQRNMTLDFATDPTGAPGSGIPGATYIGDDDPDLWDSDFVGLWGNVQWNPDLGAVGIFNTQDGPGNILVHFDNWNRDWLVKHFYVEYTYVVEGPIGSAMAFEWLQFPTGYSQGDDWYGFRSPAPNTYTVQYWTEIEPNPPYEDFYIALDVFDPSSCTAIYLTDLQIATECVPVPGATLLALLGLGAAGAKLRRFV